MFLRRCERRKNGKKHTYWALVESYRTAHGSRQRVVSYLGELAASEKPGWAKLPGPGGDETFILTRSADRCAKEHALHEKFSERLEAGLQRLRASAENGRLKDVGVAHKRLGRLKEQNWRATHVFDVTIRMNWKFVRSGITKKSALTAIRSATPMAVRSPIT